MVGAGASATHASGTACQGVAPPCPGRRLADAPRPHRRPLSTGGRLDTLARAVSQRLGTAFGQPVVAEIRAGAGGNIGAEVVAKTAPRPPYRRISQRIRLSTRLRSSPVVSGK